MEDPNTTCPQCFSVRTIELEELGRQLSEIENEYEILGERFEAVKTRVLNLQRENL